MFDDLAAYYHENVVTAFIAYRDTSKDGLAGRSRDLRDALIAATALFHLREHLPKACALSRADVEQLCPDYALLGDVVNASKHKSVTKKTPHGSTLVSDATNLGEKLVFVEYEDNAGTYQYIQKSVVVKLADGSERNLLEVLTNVMNFWEQHMLSLGVLSAARKFAYDGDIRARSRAECEANRLDFELVKGQRFYQTMQFLRFNSKTGNVEPIDLTGSKLDFRIYSPKIEIEISLTHDASGREFKKTITLTEDESALLSRMSNDAERQAYVNGLPAAQAALQQLAVEAGLVTGYENEKNVQKLEGDA
jgi:hypothetical protein